MYVCMDVRNDLSAYGNVQWDGGSEIQSSSGRFYCSFPVPLVVYRKAFERHLTGYQHAYCEKVACDASERLPPPAIDWRPLYILAR